MKRICKYISYLLALTGLMLFNVSAFTQCVSSEISFQHGEKLEYEIAYNLNFIWVDAGEVYFQVNPTDHEEDSIFHFDSYGSSFRFYDWLFKVRDHYQSKMDVKNFRPFWFKSDIHEGGHESHNSYYFNYEAGKIYTSLKHGNYPSQTDTLDLAPCTFDVLSAVYYTRNLDFSNLNPGDTIPIRFIIDGEFYNLYIRYHNREVIENRNAKKYRCIKLSALLVDGTIFSGGEDLFVWVTDDRNKIPIMAEAKILVGSVKAYLTGYENLKYELKEVKE